MPAGVSGVSVEAITAVVTVVVVLMAVLVGGPLLNAGSHAVFFLGKIA